MQNKQKRHTFRSVHWIYFCFTLGFHSAAQISMILGKSVTFLSALSSFCPWTWSFTQKRKNGNQIVELEVNTGNPEVD